MKIQESAENYLEAVLMISQRQEQVRAADLCRHLGFSRPTVSQAVRELQADGYLHIDGSNFITLTDKGMVIAKNILERHDVIAKIFIALGVSPEVAYEDACRVEHYISAETFQCMKNHYLKNKDAKRPV
jgi:Mn-dependent DtxR family transcriptional regulator